MVMENRVSALIPSYNEARTIGGIIKDLKGIGFVVYVVDDGSKDETANIAASEGAIVVKHEKNKGKGASLREGFRHILKRGFDAVLVMDGDGQHKVEDVGSFIRKMQDSGADIVVGNRMCDTSSMPPVRIYTNLLMSKLISWITGTHIPDTQNGFRLIKCDVLKKVTLESSHYDIESELIIKAARQGFRIESVPVKTVYNLEKSRINPVIDTLRFIRLMLRILLNPKS